MRMIRVQAPFELRASLSVTYSLWWPGGRPALSLPAQGHIILAYDVCIVTAVSSKYGLHAHPFLLLKILLYTTLVTNA
jgi:hypothetical protein